MHSLVHLRTFEDNFVFIEHHEIHNRIHNVYIATKLTKNCIRKGLTRVFTVPTITTKLDVANYIVHVLEVKKAKNNCYCATQMLCVDDT